MNYHSIISLFQAVKLSFIVRIGYFRIYPEDRSLVFSGSDWLIILRKIPSRGFGRYDVKFVTYDI